MEDNYNHYKIALLGFWYIFSGVHLIYYQDNAELLEIITGVNVEISKIFCA